MCLEVRVEDVCVNTEEALVDDLDPLCQVRMVRFVSSHQWLGRLESLEAAFLKFGKNGCPGCTGKKVLDE